MFLRLYPWPLLIDEVQRAPELFSVVEEIVKSEKQKRIDNYEKYIVKNVSIVSTHF